MNEILTVNFQGAELIGCRLGAGVYVALKPIIEAMGLSWHGQLERLKRSEVLKEGIRKVRIPFERGGPQLCACLELSLVHGWLLTIETGCIKDLRIRQKVLLYQRECYDVLWRYFSGQSLMPAQISPRDLSRYIKLIHEARMIYGARIAAQLWHQLGMPKVPGMEAAFAQLDLFDQAA